MTDDERPSRILDALGHGDARCGWRGPHAVQVYCPSCQPDGPGHDDDEPHLVVAIVDDDIETGHLS